MSSLLPLGACRQKCCWNRPDTAHQSVRRLGRDVSGHLILLAELLRIRRGWRAPERYPGPVPVYGGPPLLLFDSRSIAPSAYRDDGWGHATVEKMGRNPGHSEWSYRRVSAWNSEEELAEVG
jgi:hypothetical protein